MSVRVSGALILNCLAAVFYIYILYSESAGIYYVGYTDNPDRRLFEHNNCEWLKFMGTNKINKKGAVFTF